MNPSWNAVSPYEFNSWQNADLIRTNSRIPGNVVSPTSNAVAGTAAATSSKSSSLLTIILAVLLIVIIAGGSAAGVLILRQTSSGQSCSGFACSSDGACLDSSVRCDGVSQCNDGSDESGCTSSNIPIDEQYVCIGSTNVINKAQVCDGTEHCPGGTDEDRCIIAPDADNGGDVKVFSVESRTYQRICGYEDGWTNAKSDTVCGILGFQSSGSMSEEAIDNTLGVSSNGSFSLNDMVQQTSAVCTNNRVMRIFCVAVSSCGQLSRSSRIVGGSDATITDHPWQVSLRSNGVSFCGGTIAGDKLVVTAAHCLYGISSFSHIRVVAGITSLVESANEYNIESVLLHPLYSPSTFHMDIALIKVSSNFAFSSTIQKICLPPAGREYVNLATVVASGWGATSYNGPSSVILQAVSVNLYNTNECSSSSSYSQGTIVAGMVCAGVTGGGKDSCQGDSGGPLAITLSGVSYLVGATSFGHQCAVSGYPGVYAEVSYARSWIQRNI